jgi:hypothetical protein
MKIVIIGWGSLIWDPRDLPRIGSWQDGGPNLPIEFSRVSQDCRLTLVIDVENGNYVPTKYILSSRHDLDNTIKDLRTREGTVIKHIGFIDLKNNKDSGQCYTHHTKACSIIEGWLKETDFDAAVWTALPSNFKNKTELDFSIESALKYLECLPMSAQKRAREYIINTPGEADTNLRRKLHELKWVKE